MLDFKAKMHHNSISAGALPAQTPLEELYSVPQTPKLDLRGPTSNGRGRDYGRRRNGGDWIIGV